MTKAQKARLKALLAIAADKLTDKQKASLKKLQDLAKAKGYDVATDTETAAHEGTEADDDEPQPLSDDAVKALVGEATTKALKDAGIDPETFATKIKSELGANLSKENVEAAVKSALANGAVNHDELVNKLKAVLPAAYDPEATKAMIVDAVKQHATATSKMVHPNGDQTVYEIPLGGGRKGNLTVAEKQLLNILGKAMSDEAVEKTLRYNPSFKRPLGIDDGIPQTTIDAVESKGARELSNFRDGARRGKAITTTGTGTGAEIMGYSLSDTLQMRMYLDSQIAQAFISQEIEMPNNNFAIPFNTTRPAWFVGSEGGAQQPSTPGFTDILLIAKKLIASTDYSREADEDAIIAILPMLITLMASSGAEALENAIINGDTTPTHQDSDTNVVTNASAKLFKGLRKYALAGNCTVSFATGGITTANIRALKKFMKRWGLKASDLMFIAGIGGANDLAGLAEIQNFYQVGPGQQPAIVSGMAPAILGIPVITSALVREDLNASGVYDGTTTTKGSLLLVYKPAWIMGVRRKMLVETYYLSVTQLSTVTASFRRAFQPIETPSAALPYVSLGFNYQA